MLFNLDPTTKYALMVYILYIYILLISVPLMHLPALKTIEETYFLQETCKIKEKFWLKMIIRFPLVIFFIFVVSRIKDIGSAIDFFGALFFTILSFIAPPLIYEHNVKNNKPYLSIINYSILVFGIIFGGLGAAYSLSSAFEIV